MIEVYKDRLEKADWLAPETREKAIVKLNVITPHIGYPEKLPETYAKKDHRRKQDLGGKCSSPLRNFRCPYLEQVEPTS